MAFIIRELLENRISEEQIKEIYNIALSRASREPIDTGIIVSTGGIEVRLTYKDGWGHFVFTIAKNGDYKTEHQYECIGKYSLLENNIITDLAAKKEPAASESIKNDFADKKPRWDLLPIDELGGVVDVYTAGAKKYGENRWQRLENGVNRYMGAFFRHLTAHKRGEHFDPEDGCLHLDKCIWNMIAVRHCFLADKGINPNTSDYSALHQ